MVLNVSSYRNRFQRPNAAKQYHESLKQRIDWPLWEQLIAPDLKLILNEIRRSGAESYLDFACGTGRVVEIGKCVFRDATAIDISPEMIEHAAGKHPEVRFVVGDVTRQSNTLEGVFDCVTMFRFLLNAESDLRKLAMKWIGEHVPKGGYLIGNIHLQTMSISGLLARGAYVMGRKHVSHLGRKQTEELLANAGFRVESWQGYRVLPTVKGRAILGNTMQIAAERLCRVVGLGRLGADHVFIARKVDELTGFPVGRSA